MNLPPLPEWSPELEHSKSAIDRFIHSNEPLEDQEHRQAFRQEFSEALAAKAIRARSIS